LEGPDDHLIGLGTQSSATSAERKLDRTLSGLLCLQGEPDAENSIRFFRFQYSGSDARACYNSRMLEPSRRQKLKVRVIRDGQPEPLSNDWIGTTPEERIETVWELTKLCIAWKNDLTGEPRLQRTVTRLQRAPR